MPAPVPTRQVPTTRLSFLLCPMVALGRAINASCGNTATLGGLRHSHALPHFAAGWCRVGKIANGRHGGATPESRYLRPFFLCSVNQNPGSGSFSESRGAEVEDVAFLCVGGKCIGDMSSWHRLCYRGDDRPSVSQGCCGDRLL